MLKVFYFKICILSMVYLFFLQDESKENVEPPASKGKAVKSFIAFGLWINLKSRFV